MENQTNEAAVEAIANASYDVAQVIADAVMNPEPTTNGLCFFLDVNGERREVRVIISTQPSYEQALVDVGSFDSLRVL